MPFPSRRERLRRALQLPEQASAELTEASAPEPDEFDPLDQLREPFVRWLDECVVWSARWCTSLKALHNSCAEWIARQDQVPPDPLEFKQLLTELGSIIHFAGDLVLGIALREDVQAHERFQAPAPPPSPPAPTATERAINPAWRRK